MRKLAFVLAAVTAILAVTTAYYARQLYLARVERAAQESAVRRAAAPVRATVRDAAIPASSTAQAGGPAHTKNASTPRDRLGPYQASILARMRDPAQRRDLLDERKASLRRVSPYLAEYLRLGSSEFEAFVELVAGQNLAMHEKTLSCLETPKCQVLQTAAAMQDALIDEIARSFGLEKAGRYRHYLATADERTYIAEMRGGLPDRDRLTDTQAEALIDALAGERVRIGEEITARSQIAGITMEGVPFVMSTGATIATLMEQAHEYFRRMRAHAAPMLTPGQLAAYDRIQEERLRRLPYMLGGTGLFSDAPNR
jgi:hypothetical protein